MQPHPNSYSPQLDDTKRLADAEARDRATLMSKFKNLSSELDTMRERIEEESEQKAEILKQLSKAQAEIQLWRSKYETEGLGRWVDHEDVDFKGNVNVEDYVDDEKNAGADDEDVDDNKTVQDRRA